MAYTKLFTSIITSTIWAEDDATRIVWITLLALADKNGEVQGSVPGIARMAAVSIESCRAAFVKFMSPDPDSRTKDDEGRRVEEIEGGWVLLNHQKYRDMSSGEDRKVQAAIRQKRARQKRERNGQIVTHSHAPVTKSHAPVTHESRQICQAEAEAEAEAEATSLKMSKETKETPAFAAVVCLKSEEIPAESKPDTRTKNAKLAALKVPDFPSEREFDAFVSDEFLDNIGTYKGGLYQDLCARKWHEWNEPLAKWVPVRDWKSYVTALDGTIEDANTNR
jgi:hypothetical protein